MFGARLVKRFETFTKTSATFHGIVPKLRILRGAKCENNLEKSLQQEDQTQGAMKTHVLCCFFVKKSSLGSQKVSKRFPKRSRRVLLGILLALAFRPLAPPRLHVCHTLSHPILYHFALPHLPRMRAAAETDAYWSIV